MSQHKRHEDGARPLTRLILWKLEGVTITRRGIWQRDRSIIDVVETDKPDLLAEFRERFADDVAEGAARGERLEVTEHAIPAFAQAEVSL